MKLSVSEKIRLILSRKRHDSWGFGRSHGTNKAELIK